MFIRPFAVPVQASGIGNTGTSLDVQPTENLLDCILNFLAVRCDRDLRA